VATLCQLQPQIDVLDRRATAAEGKTAAHQRTNEEKHRGHEAQLDQLMQVRPLSRPYPGLYLRPLLAPI